MYTPRAFKPNKRVNDRKKRSVAPSNCYTFVCLRCLRHFSNCCPRLGSFNSFNCCFVMCLAFCRRSFHPSNPLNTHTQYHRPNNKANT